MNRTRPLLALLSLALIGGGLLVAVEAAVPKKRDEDHIKGKELWERSCWHCHGKGNAGDGPAAASLPVGVPNLQGQIRPDRFDALVEVIMTGKGAMPAFEAELDRHNARRVLVYLNKLDAEESWPAAKRGGVGDDEEAKDSDDEAPVEGEAEGDVAPEEAPDLKDAKPLRPKLPLPGKAAPRPLPKNKSDE
ncbi:MAG: c-type cytochrome [Alphaproteobacteria bacterium]|nr:c-type cytochrome [Alphaproteobacteria bacterium]